MRLLTLDPAALADFAGIGLDAERAEDVRRYAERMLAAGALRPEWCFILEDAGQAVGRVAYWTQPSAGKPLDIVLLEAPWDADYLSVGTYLPRETLARMAALGAESIGHALDIPPQPPQWQLMPDHRAALLEHLGFTQERTTRRFELPADVPRARPTTRLTFRSISEMGEPAFLDAIARVTEGTLDQLLASDREQLGRAEAAHKLFEILRGMEYDPAWWQLAYTRTGELAGLVMPAALASGAAVIGYIGVMPAQRGHGAIDELLARAAITLHAAGYTSVLADTDVGNTPMANALLRAGYREFATRREYRMSLRSDRSSR